MISYEIIISTTEYRNDVSVHWMYLSGTVAINQKNSGTESGRDV